VAFRKRLDFLDGGRDSVIFLEVQCVGSATNYTVCVAQFSDLCGSARSSVNFRFISCPTMRLTKDDIAKSLCVVTDADGKKKVGRYRIVPLGGGDTPSAKCGISVMKISCLDN